METTVFTTLLLKTYPKRNTVDDRGSMYFIVYCFCLLQGGGGVGARFLD